MSEDKKAFHETAAFQTVYKVGIGIKGFDGLVELVAGLALLISPALVHNALTGIVKMLGQHDGRVFQFITEYVARLNDDFTKTGLTFLIIFLISHGLIKLALVYALLKEIVKAYPYALVILALFLIYQLYVFIIHPTIGMALFTILDVIIIWLVGGEYKDLRNKK
jgi:uncharacterized membrane protein